jgi:hypothetical protein
MRADALRRAILRPAASVNQMTDARTARMKLSVVSCLGVLLAASVVAPHLMH